MQNEAWYTLVSHRKRCVHVNPNLLFLTAQDSLLLFSMLPNDHLAPKFECTNGGLQASGNGLHCHFFDFGFPHPLYLRM